MKTYASIVGGAILGVVGAVQLSGDLAIPGLMLGAFLGWFLIGRKTGEDPGETSSDPNAGFYDDNAP